MLLASGFAEWAGCQVNEASAQPCLVGDADRGGLLVTLFTMGWLMLVTAPFMRASLVGWAPVLVRQRRQRRDASWRFSSRLSSRTSGHSSRK